MKKALFTFIDLFAGIGGFHTAMHSVGGKCVFASEWDKYARLSYESNYKQGRRIKLNFPSTAYLSSPHSIPLSVVLG